MKKLLFMLLLLITSPAWAGFDHSTQNIYNATEPAQTELDTNCRVPVYDLDADDDGVLDNVDPNAEGSADFLGCDKFGIGGDAVTYSTALTGNPFVKGTSKFVALADVNTSAALIASAEGKAIKIHGWSLFASGAMGGLTALTIDCHPGTPTKRNLTTIPLMYLSDGIRHGEGLPWTADDGSVVFASGVTYTSALTRGCDPGDAVFLSKTGLDGTGSEGVVINIDYTWQ